MRFVYISAFFIHYWKQSNHSRRSYIESVLRTVAQGSQHTLLVLLKINCSPRSYFRSYPKLTFCSEWVVHAETLTYVMWHIRLYHVTANKCRELEATTRSFPLTCVPTLCISCAGFYFHLFKNSTYSNILAVNTGHIAWQLVTVRVQILAGVLFSHLSRCGSKSANFLPV